MQCPSRSHMTVHRWISWKQYRQTTTDPDRLRALDMPTFRYRRLRGDMIKVYNILHGRYHKEVPQKLHKSMNVTGRCSRHSLMLFQERGGHRNLQLRKHSFTMRVVAVWNSLTEKVVMAPNNDCFKRRLDKHWKHDHRIERA